MEDMKERVYLTLTSNLIPEYCVPGVRDAFATGSFCHCKYKEILEAYDRVCQRLGVGEEDDDLEIIMNNFLDIAEHLGLEMYAYGACFWEKP